MNYAVGGLAAIAVLAFGHEGRAGEGRADEPERCATEAEAAQAARAAGKLRSAREHVIACARDSCPRVIRTDCTRWLTEIEVELPTIVVRARDASGADLSEVAVFVDDAKVVERVDGKPIPLDVGEHLLRFERRGAGAPSRASQRVIVRSGERARIVTITFDDGSAARPKNTVGPIVLGGLGLSLATGGAILWAVARGEHSDLESSCAPTGTCASSDISDGKTKLLIGDVAVAVGVLAVAGAVYWYFTSGSSRTAQRRVLPTLMF